MVRKPLLALLVWSVLVPAARAAEDEPKGADLVSSQAMMVLQVTDLPAFRKALADSDFGKLWAEPQMQLFAKPAVDAALEQYGNLRQNAPLPDLKDLEKTLTGGLCVSITPRKHGPASVEVAVKIGDVQAAERILGPVLQDKKLAEGVAVQITPNEKGPALVYAKGFLLVANNAEALAAMHGRLSDAAKRADGFGSSKPWQQALKLLGGPGQATFFLDSAKLTEFSMQSMQPHEVVKLKKALNAAGVDGARGLAIQIGTRGSLMTLDMAVPLEGEPKGFFAAAKAAQPIDASALTVVPATSSFCTVSRLDLPGTWAQVRAFIEGEDPNFSKGMAEAKEALGLDLEKDFLPVFGDTWVVYDVGGSEFMGLMPGLALSVEVPDPAKATQAFDTLLGALAKLPQRNPMGEALEIKDVQVGEVKVRYLSYGPMPFSPALAIVGKRLFLTASVASMRRALKHVNGDQNIASTPGFKEALERATGKPLDLKALPARFSYSCSAEGKENTQVLAQYMQVFFGAMRAEMKMMAAFRGQQDPGQAFAGAVMSNLDFALFPEEEVLSRHMHPAASVTMFAEGGLVTKSDIPVPSTGAIGSGQGGVYVLPVVAAIAIPNLLRSRLAANESAAIAACKTYAEAQDIYRRTDWDGDGVLEYAQGIKGNASLYEKDEGQGNLTLVDAAFANAEKVTTFKPVEDKDLPEPTKEEAEAFAKALAKLSADDFQERENASAELQKMGPGIVKLLAKAVAESKDVEVRQRCKTIADALRAELAKKNGVTTTDAAPKAGYYFKILKGQGKSAPGGVKSYVAAGNMTLGYALVAWPAAYDGTGRNTFIINNTGTVWQKDLGVDTEKMCEEMNEYNPDQTWVVSE